MECHNDDTGTNGTGANDTGTNGTGANDTGTNDTGTSETGTNGTGANGTGANGTGFVHETVDVIDSSMFRTIMDVETNAIALVHGFHGFMGSWFHGVHRFMGSWVHGFMGFMGTYIYTHMQGWIHGFACASPSACMRVYVHAYISVLCSTTARSAAPLHYKL